ncbi:MAG TPA: hypothetical protein VMV86_00620 [Methanosarcinales archaeon]|nr:hypothetical protein [Methanosarcinales archaeon]
MPEEIRDQELGQEVVQEVEEGLEQEAVDNTGVDNTSVEEAEDSLEEQIIPKEDAKPSEKEENLKALRESRRQLQKERDEYLKRIQALEASQFKKTNDLDFDEDEYDPNKKEIKLLKQQYAEMAVNNSRMKLYSQFPDFSKVVTEESISILRQRFPEIAATLDNGQDFYSTGASTYNIIKKFGLHVEEDYVNERERVEKNLNKPKPVSSIKSTSALSNARDYSDLSDKKVRAEIIRIATERAGG